MSQQERDVFFYHSDHLGSSSFITNTEGEVVQHIEYVPYGEVFIEERNNVWNTPYLFNAKEFDEETGLYYYGARYYDSRLAMWYSVDALAEKYPNMGGYVYCAGNPVKLVDVDGNEFDEISEALVAKVETEAGMRISQLTNKNAKLQDRLNNSTGLGKIFNGLRAKRIQSNNNRIEGYKAAKNEINVLRTSTQMYSVIASDEYSKRIDDFTTNVTAATRFNSKTSTVELVVPKGSSFVGLLAHELKHAYQFEMGEFSFNGSGGFPFYDITDEYEAYDRGTLFGQSSPAREIINRDYSNLQKNECSVNSCFTEEQKQATTFNVSLTNLAKRYKTIFRYQGVTYK